MINLEIRPSFMACCDFTLRSQEDTPVLIFRRHAEPRLELEELVLETEVKDTDAALRIQKLAETVVEHAFQDRRIILDGVGLNCRIEKKGISCEHRYRCPEKDSYEFLLVAELANLSQRCFHQQEFINYMESLEGYFLNKLPVKTFDEEPYRIRIYGTLYSEHKEQLETLFREHLHRESLVIDMSNFEGMAAMLFESFRLLDVVPELKIWANGAAVHFLEVMGIEYLRLED